MGKIKVCIPFWSRHTANIRADSAMDYRASSSICFWWVTFRWWYPQLKQFGPLVGQPGVRLCNRSLSAFSHNALLGGSGFLSQPGRYRDGRKHCRGYQENRFTKWKKGGTNRIYSQRNYHRFSTEMQVPPNLVTNTLLP